MFQEQKEKENEGDNDQDIASIPVHTMQKDLEYINNPAAAKTDEESAISLPKKPTNSASLTATQKSSPFLNTTPAQAPAGRPEPIKVFPKPAPMTAESAKDSFPSPLKTPASPEQKAHSKKPLVLIFATLIILIIAGGGYYFWNKNNQPKPVVIAEPAPAPAPAPAPEPEPQPATPQFNADKPNYLTIDPTNPDAGALKNTIASYVSQVSQSNLKTPLEFVVVDAQKNPIPFTDFAKSFGLKLSPAVTANLADTFSLFIYNDQGAMRLGLAIDSKNDSLLKAAMAQEEKNVISEISPLLLDTAFTAPKSIVFSNSIYNTAQIRYINLIPDQTLAVDYSIFNKKLILSTSKMTTRSIVDYLSANQPSPLTSTSTSTSNAKTHATNTSSANISQTNVNSITAQ